jgi:hypothetical protein
MKFKYNLASNVAVPLLTPSENGQEVIFDADNKLAIAGCLDYRVSPVPNPTVPLLNLGEHGQKAVFNANTKLAIAGSMDDRAAPASNRYNPELLHRWYVCNTYAGNLHITLAWTLGQAAPQNPTCEKVDVVRVFAYNMDG